MQRHHKRNARLAATFRQLRPESLHRMQVHKVWRNTAEHGLEDRDSRGVLKVFGALIGQPHADYRNLVDLIPEQAVRRRVGDWQ
ncbi:hypothetical protein D3C76_761340 [compost metagenome]